jgi:hypothetical protein
MLFGIIGTGSVGFPVAGAYVMPVGVDQGPAGAGRGDVAAGLE